MYKNTLSLSFFFSRSSKKLRYSLAEMEVIQQKTLNDYVKKYNVPNDFFPHEDILMEEELYGKKFFISGTTPNNYQSTTFVKEVIQCMMPKHIVLGGIADSDIPDIPSEGYVRQKSGQRYLSSKMFCKSELLRYIDYLRQSDPNILFDYERGYVLRIDHYNRKIVTDDYLSAALNTIYHDECKISYGKPSDMIVFEDLILNCSVENLTEIYIRNMAKITERTPMEYVHYPSQILECLRYYVINEEPSLYSKQVTYTTALLRKYVKSQYKLLLMAPANFVREIARNVHYIEVDPDKIYRNFLADSGNENYAQLHRIINEKLIDEVLDKFALLSILMSGNLEHQLVGLQKNIFAKSIFKDLFAEMSIEEIINRYLMRKKPFRHKILDIQAMRIRVLKYLLTQNIEKFAIPEVKKLTLKQQLSTIQHRFNENSYGYLSDNSAIRERNAELLQELHKRMRNILIEEGTQQQRDLLDSYISGTLTREGIILYSKLIGRANAEMPNRLKLPTMHFAAFRGIHKDHLRNHILQSQNQKNEGQISQKLNQLQNKLKDRIRVVKDPQQIDDFLSGKKGKLIAKLDFEQDASQEQFKETLQDLIGKLKDEGMFEGMQDPVKK